MPASPPEADYYSLLGIDPSATPAQLRRAWRTLAARHHPDRAGPAAAPTFQRLAHAYQTLIDPLKRAAYDRRRRTTHPTPPTTTPSAPDPPSSPTPAQMLPRHAGNLISLLNSGAARVEDDDTITLLLSPREAAQGGMAYVALPIDLHCPTCTATTTTTLPKTPCPQCQGKRTIETLYTAWLAIPPGIADNQPLAPTVTLPNMIYPLRFRVSITPTR